jgi:hypothetical protein
MPKFNDDASPLLTKFATDHNMRLKRDDCADWNAPGSAGSICDYGDNRHLLATVRTGKGGWWTPISKEAIAAGCTITQNGDIEGCFTFDPMNSEMSALALRAIRPFKKRSVASKAA